MKINFSEFASHYVGARRRSGAQPTWPEVAAAYDAGLTHAIAVSPVKRRQLVRFFRALRIINGERRQGTKE